MTRIHIIVALVFLLIPALGAAQAPDEGTGAKVLEAAQAPDEGTGAMALAAAEPPIEGAGALGLAAAEPPIEGAGALGLEAAEPPIEGAGAIVGGQIISSFLGVDDRAPRAPEQSVFVDDMAPGLQLWFGYAFKPSFLARVAVSGAAHATNDPDVHVQASSALVEGVFMLRTRGLLRPYLFTGVGAYALRSLEDDFRFQTEGVGFELGAGASYFISRRVSLDFSVRADAIHWSRATARRALPGGASIAVDNPVDRDEIAGKALFGIGVWF